MEALQFTITIDAPAAKVWEVMLGKETYKQWTGEFYPGSYYEGGWNKGDSIHFVAPEEDGSISGIAGEVIESEQYKFVSVRYIGLIQNGEVDTESPEVQQWIGNLESYTFEEVDDKTIVTVDLDISPEDRPMFEESWPSSLQKLKQVVES